MRAAAALAVFASASPAGAEDLRLPALVVTGTRTAHEVDDAPLPVEVIAAEEIAETATENVEAALTRIPDLHIRRNEAFSLGASTVRMQGLDPDKVAILVDGQRVRGGPDGIVDLRDLPAEGIEQIEILRGPASSLYGSDAMAGVVNIRTRPGSERPELGLTAGLGSADKRLLTLAHSGRVGALGYRAHFQHEAVAITDLYGSVSDQYSGARADDLQERNGARLRLDYATGAHDLGATLDWLREDNPLSFNDNLGGNLSWGWKGGGRWSTEAILGGYTYARENDLERFGEDVDYDEIRGDLRTVALFDGLAGSDHLLSLGVRGRTESFGSAAATINTTALEAPAVDESVYTISPYAQDEILIGEAWTVVAGASLDIHDLFGVETNPRLALTWRPSPVWKTSLTVGRGYRTPTLLQLFDIDINNVAVVGDRVTGYAIVGNPDLKPETDIGVSLFSQWRPLPSVELSLNGYHHELEDLIATTLLCLGPTNCPGGATNPLPDLNGQIFTYANVSAARASGVDASLVVSLLELAGYSSAHELELELRGGWLRTENRGHIATEHGNELTFRPAWRVLPGLAWRRRDRQMSARLWTECNGRQYSDLANSDEGRIDPYCSVSFKLVQGLDGVSRMLGAGANPWLAPLSLFVEGDNLADADADYTGTTGTLLRRRNFQAGLRMQITFEEQP